MDEQNMELAKILERLAALEKENQSLKAEVEELKSNDIEIKNELNTINRFISAMTESQSIDEIMTEVESAAKQLTNSDEVKFFCMDNTNDKFFSESGGRNWISQEQTEMLKKISDNQEIQNEGTKAYIPLVAGNGNTLGVIAAERSEGFNTDDLARNFAKGGTFVENIKLGLEKEYQHQGRITDELTKMFNRQGLNEYLENTVVKAMSEGKSVNILMSDIDRFKSVNDTYGHDAGDIILKGTAEVMKDFTKDGANNCFRMGGEEMIAILITDTPEQAVDMAETLRKNVEENVNEIMFEGKPMEHSVTVSIGVHAMNPEVTLTRENAREVFDAEFKLADNAVYEAKETGRNKVVCAEEQTYISYLAMKAAEVMAKSGGIEDKGALAELKKTTEDNLVNTENGEIDTVVDALRTCAFQAYDSMPDIAELADMIADKIEAYAEKTAEPAVGIKEAEAPIQNEEAKELTAAVTADKSEVKSENVPVGHLEAEEKTAEKISFAEKASAIKDWAEKVNEKAAEKDIQNEQKKGGDSR
ncbi:MAG: diguanylate cyclase [Oscillospiraceae bacterium]